MCECVFVTDEPQKDLFENESEFQLLDKLIDDAKLYRTTAEFKELLDFISKFPHIAPFNAMLLQIQKPGLSFATSKYEWKKKYNREPKEDARPLVILWPFSPVAFVFDVQDTEGAELPPGFDVFHVDQNPSVAVKAHFQRIARKKNSTLR